MIPRIEDFRWISGNADQPRMCQHCGEILEKGLGKMRFVEAERNNRDWVFCSVECVQNEIQEWEHLVEDDGAKPCDTPGCNWLYVPGHTFRWIGLPAGDYCYSCSCDLEMKTFGRLKAPAKPGEGQNYGEYTCNAGYGLHYKGFN